MAAAKYERISVEDGDAEHPLAYDVDGQTHGVIDEGIGSADYYDVSKPHGAPDRPPVYYEDGPFDAPSSDSEEETLLEKGRSSPGAAENGLMNGDSGLMLSDKKVLSAR